MDAQSILDEEIAALSETGYMPLMQAIQDNDLLRVESLLVEGANVNACGRRGLTPLWLAAYHGNAEIVRLLLDFEADSSIGAFDGGYGGRTPLICAIRQGHSEIVALLLAHGAFVNAPDNAGTTPLMFAIIDNRLDIIPLLLEWGANVFLQNKRGKSALDYAGEYHRVEAMRLLQQHPKYDEA